jgi:hypothetical protein
MVGLVGLQSERFRRVTLSDADLTALTILGSASSFDGEGNLLRLGIQAYSLGIASEFDPYFGLSISRVDPLPHQREPIKDPARLQWTEVVKVAHYRIDTQALPGGRT